MMCASTKEQDRSGNRLYEWLKKKHRLAMSKSQTGSKNSQFGTTWVFNQILKEEKKIQKDDLQKYILDGWELGRKPPKKYTCKVCLKIFNNNFKKNTCSDECFKISKKPFQKFKGREQEFLNFYNESNSMNKALKQMGFKGAVSHYHEWARTLIKKN